MHNVQLVIMAAGLGSRYGGLKQIDAFGPSGEYLMDYAIYDAYKLGVRRIWLVVRDFFKQDFQELVTQKWREYHDLEFEFVCQEISDVPRSFCVSADRAKPWGTAHILYVLRNRIKSPFVIINADDFYGRRALTTLYEFLYNNPDQHAMVGYPLQQTLSPHGGVTRGICKIKSNYLVSVDEVSGIGPDDPRQEYVSMNLWGFAPTVFAIAEEFFKKFLSLNVGNSKSEYPIPVMINELLHLAKIKVVALTTDEQWFGVTYQADKKPVQDKINHLVATQMYPHNLFLKKAE